MSQAFKCDLCGDCVPTEDLAKPEKEVAHTSTTISGTLTDVGIILKVYQPHVCNACWVIVKQRAKAWMEANL